MKVEVVEVRRPGNRPAYRILVDGVEMRGERGGITEFWDPAVAERAAERKRRSQPKIAKAKKPLPKAGDVIDFNDEF